MPGKIWFVTGSSKGFGRVWTEAALKRGDRVAATARNVDDLQALIDDYGDLVLPIALDVTDRAAVFAAAAQAKAHFGRIDVVINNAGYGLFGMVEEASEEEARSQVETNLFGALWVIQAMLPILREQKGGHILSVSSIGGVTAFPTFGLYHATKWGLEGLNQALAQEVADFGIRITLIEPGGYATEWRGTSAKHSDRIAAYDPVRQRREEGGKGRELGDPEHTAEAVLKVVDADDPPLRLILGGEGLPMFKKDYESRIAEWDAWSDVSKNAQ